MIVNGFLIIDDRGSVRMTKGRPYLRNNEVAVQIKINVPDAFFERMIPVVEIDLPKEAVAEPDVSVALNITAQKVADALKLDVQYVYDGLKGMVESVKEEEDTPLN